MVGGARHEARFIVDEALGGGGAGGARPGVVPVGAAAVARAMAARRAAGEPLQYVFGHWPFRGLDLRVDPRVLIPRPETEQVVEVALGEARRLRGAAAPGHRAWSWSTPGPAAAPSHWRWPPSSVPRRCTRCGPPTPARRRSRWRRPTWAACVPRRGGAAAAVELVEGSWLAPLPERLRGRVDLVVSNPPYVTEGGVGRRWTPRCGPSRGRRWSPGPADGHAGRWPTWRPCSRESRRWLGRPGAVVVELAPTQAGPAERWARQLGYDEVRVENDLAGRPRALVARLSG